jgi:hypothetical protein
MRSRWPFAAALAAGLVLAGGISVRAQEVDIENFKVRDAGSLARLCDTAEGRPLYAQARQFCYGYIAGAATVYREAVAAGGMQKSICASKEPTLEEMRAAFTSWIGRNQNARDEDAADGVLRAVAAKYPCA